jgi:hypothetical protein
MATIAPERILEGEGSSESGRKVPVVLAGSGFQGGELQSETEDLLEIVAGTSCVSENGAWIAALASVAVNTEQGAGDPNGEAEVSVALEGEAVASASISIEWLNELVVPFESTLSVPDDLEDQVFSRVLIEGQTTIEGSRHEPARLVATGDIEVRAPILAAGEPGAGIEPGVGGPGGCPGGSGSDVAGVSNRGGCGGGGGGASALIGSGGGNRFPGHQGAPDSEPGAQTGSDDVYPLGVGDPSQNRGNGGGAVVNESVSLRGAGGGGGGVVVLSAGGTLTFDLADDGAGAIPVSVAGGKGDSVGGGGGSGGILLLRGSEIHVDGSFDLDAALAGGFGGGEDPDLGQGAPGRARIDATQLVYLSTDDAPLRGEFFRGPSFGPETPQIVGGNGSMTFRIFGEPQRTFAIFARHEDEGTYEHVGDATPNDLGEATVVAPQVLEPGRNELCIFVPTARFQAMEDVPPELIGDEGKTCLDVAYVPGGACGS